MGAFCHVLLFRGRVGGWAGAWLCLWWVKPSTCPMLEDEWLPTTRSRRNVAVAPSGNSEEMIHFQHHFTQDDLITACEWTVPSMRPRQVHRVEVWHAYRCPLALARRRKKNHISEIEQSQIILELAWVALADRNSTSGEWRPSFLTVSAILLLRFRIISKIW